MPIIHPAALDYERKRWLRHDAHRFIRPDWRRFVTPGSELAALYEDIERKYRPDQSRVPAGVPEGGQRTSDDGGEIPTNAKPAQYTGRERSTLAEILLSKGGENLGSFGDRVSVVKGPNISHQESYDPESGRTILSFTGIGSVVVDENDGTTLRGSAYHVGTATRPDQGLSIIIDRNGKVQVNSTSGS
jgi:hypothetical protein